MNRAARALAHLRAIAHEPRPAGGYAEARARTYCANVLRDAGFDVRDVAFEYSAAVGMLAMPLAGTLWAAMLLVAARAATRGHAAIALALLVAMLVAIALGARVATARGVLHAPVMRRRSTNLVATRGDAVPRVWLVAHLDSKSQPVPMAARVFGVGGSLLIAAVAVGLALAQLAGVDVHRLWTTLAALGTVVALPVIGSGIGARSPGALDDGSGVVTVLLAACEATDAPLGVLLTSAEELGLAGARAWAESDDARRAVSTHERPVALNVDVVDDVGELRVMTASTLPLDVERALSGERVRRGALPPGVLVDAIALAAGGFAALTVSRATVRTLARVHTPNDACDALRGDGMVDAAALVRRLAVAAATLDPVGAAG